MRRSVFTATAAVAAGLVIAACGGSSNTADTTQPTVTINHTVTEPATQTQTQTRPLTDTTATNTTTTPHASGAACTSSDLTPAYLGSNGGGGAIVLGFALKNTGSATCHTYGWPGVQFLDSSGKKLPTTGFKTTSDKLGDTHATVLTLKPGEEASFRIVASDIASGGGSCPTTSGLQIYPPDDTATVKVSLPGIEACSNITWSPLLPGTSAFPNPGGGGGGQTGVGSGSGSGSGGSGSGGSGSGSGGSGSGSGGSGSGGTGISG